MIKRFEFTCADCDPDIVSVNHGRWVSFSDYEALRAAKDAELAELSRLLENEKFIGASGATEWMQRAEDALAERLAGARVVTDEIAEVIADLEYWGERLADVGQPQGSSALKHAAHFLSALAEPAGEAEPRQFLPTEDGEFNGNTTETPIAAKDGREVDWVDVTGWAVFKGHAIPVDVARYIAEKINLYAEHRATPPDASAIRGAAEMARACLAGIVSAGHNSKAPDPEQIETAFWTLDKALAGAKP